MVGRRKPNAIADTAQQLVWSFHLSGPFVVTEDIRGRPDNMQLVHVVTTVTIVFDIGYAALYKADARRDPDSEMDVAGVPVQFISLLAVAYSSVLLLALAFSAPDTIVQAPSQVGRWVTAVKAASVGAVFSVIGAATADSIH